MLIGADIYWQVVTGEIKKNDSGLTALNSSFGWLLNGPVPCRNQSSNVNCVTSDVIVMKIQSEDVLLSEQVKTFWDLDTVGIRENEQSIYENIYESIEFKDKRYEVPLPFKETAPTIPDNYELSLKRLKSLKSRLSSNPVLLKKYDDVFQEQLKLGIVEKVYDTGDIGCVTYLPHKEVIREDKTSTKLRVVLDGVC